jgi:hypothetical protein
MNKLQQKLLDCEVMPPQRSWDKIAAALSDGPVALSPADKLYNLEVGAPATVWSQIAASLDADTAPVQAENTIAPVRNSKMAGVTKTVSTPAVTTTPVETTTPAPIDTDVKPKTAPTVEEYRHLDRVAKVNMRKAIAEERYQLPAAASQALYTYENEETNMADRYVMLLTPDGSIIRMSKKLGDLICCVSGEEQTGDCKDQLKRWQEKLANSTAAPSPANVLDILSLVNSLEDTEL